MQSTVTDQELQLVDMVGRLDHAREGYRAVHVKLSRLRPQFRKDHHIRAAAGLFDIAATQLRGQMFRLSNADLVMLWQGGRPDYVEDVFGRLKTLFADDPMLRNGAGHDQVRSYFDLTTQYEAFKTVCEKLLVEAEEKRQQEIARNKPPPGSGTGGQAAARRAEERELNNPANNSRLYDIVKNLDVSALIRRQPICAVVGKADPVPVYTELYISIADMQRLVMPNVDIASDRWLFQYTTQILDRRVLALMPQLESSLEGNSSININISSLLSQEFLDFDARIRAATRKTILFEVQALDVMADIPGFLFARDFVRDRGYRLVLDGLTWTTFPLIDRNALGVDLVKFHWQPEILDDASEARRTAFQAAVQKTGIDRVVMCRVDSQEAIDWATQFGLSLFQGRLIETRYLESKKVIRVKNPAASDSRSLNFLAKQGKV